MHWRYAEEKIVGIIKKIASGGTYKRGGREKEKGLKGDYRGFQIFNIKTICLIIINNINKWYTLIKGISGNSPIDPHFGLKVRTHLT